MSATSAEPKISALDPLVRRVSARARQRARRFGAHPARLSARACTALRRASTGAHRQATSRRTSSTRTSAPTSARSTSAVSQGLGGAGAGRHSQLVQVAGAHRPHRAECRIARGDAAAAQASAARALHRADEPRGRLGARRCGKLAGARQGHPRRCSTAAASAMPS